MVDVMIRVEASEASLLGGLTQSGGSKVVIPRSLVNSAEGHLADTDVVRLRKKESNKENSFPNSCPSDPPSPVDPNHKPSYLKLSCAVSGYGKYSRYSTYKDVNKRSPYSSQSSLRSEASSPDPSMPAEHRCEKSGDESSPDHKAAALGTPPTGRPRSQHGGPKLNGEGAPAQNGHAPKYPTGDTEKDGEYFLQHTLFEEDRIRGQSTKAEVYLRAEDLPEEACGKIRSAIGKANLLVTQKFVQFRELCHNHMQPDPEERETKWGDLQGFWDMVKLQVDNVDDMFAEIELLRDNGWQELPKIASRRSSASSSPKSGCVSGPVSQASTPAATPGHTPSSKRRNLKPTSTKDTPDSSPERTQKARQAAKARDEARRKLLAERRAAMKQAATAQADSNKDVEIYLPEPPKK